MRFGFRCPQDHELIENFGVGQAPNGVWCTEHNAHCPRVFDVPYFVEDRLRMRTASANNPNPEWSWTLGGKAPQSRQERRIIEKSKGIEFVTPSEARADAAKLRAGQNLDAPVKPEKGYLAKEFAKRGIRIRDSAASPARVLNREESERKLKAETADSEWGGWDSTADAQAKVSSPDKLPA